MHVDIESLLEIFLFDFVTWDESTPTTLSQIVIISIGHLNEVLVVGLTVVV